MTDHPKAPPQQLIPSHLWKGNLANRLKLVGLSLLFSGFGQVQGGHKIKGLVFLLAPLVGAIAAVLFQSPSYLYLALCMGLMTGPLALTAVYAAFLDYQLFVTPLFWFGLPIKLLSVIDSWFLGGKKKPIPVRKRWLVAFAAVSLGTLVMFHLKFTVISIGHASTTPLTEPGDTIVVLRSRSVTGGTLNTISRSLRRGSLVAIRTDSGLRLARIVGLPQDKVVIRLDGTGKLAMAITSQTGFLDLAGQPNPDPCVLLEGRTYLRCIYYDESPAKGKRYSVAYPSSAERAAVGFDHLEFTVPEGEYFLLPDIRTRESLAHYLMDNKAITFSRSSIYGIPLTVLWSSHPKEGIRWHRLGKTIPTS